MGFLIVFPYWNGVSAPGVIRVITPTDHASSISIQSRQTTSFTCSRINHYNGIKRISRGTNQRTPEVYQKALRTTANQRCKPHYTFIHIHRDKRIKIHHLDGPLACWIIVLQQKSKFLPLGCENRFISTHSRICHSRQS